MGKKYLIRGFREKTDFPTLCDDKVYSLKDAINKAKEYFEQTNTISKIILFEQEIHMRKERLKYCDK